MTNPNQHIIDYLDFYYKLENPKFAIMLKGEWGCGKTWFIKNYMEGIEKNKDNPIFIYLSLNGISEIKNIETNLSAKLFQDKILKDKLNKKIVEGLKGIYKTASSLPIVNQFIPSVPIVEILRAFNLKSLVFIFDDLERCEIANEIIFGFINQFVEHLGIKIIILGHEEKEEDTYKEIKEKLIGKTFKVTPNTEEAIKYFIKDVFLTNIFLNDFFSNKVDLLMTIFIQSKYKNLRLMRYALIDFERYFKNLPEKYYKNIEFINLLIQWFFVMSIESTGGDFLPSIVENFHQRLKNELVKEYAKTEDKKSKRVILDTFLKYDIHVNILQDTFLSLDIWEDFIINGYIQESLLLEAFDNSKILQKIESPSWKKLYHRELTDEEFPNVLTQLFEELEHFQYFREGEIIHIFGILLFYSEKKLLDMKQNDIFNMLIKYTEDLISKNLLTIEGELLMRRQSAYGLGFYREEEAVFKQFSERIEQLINQKSQDDIKEEIAELTENNLIEFIIKISKPQERNDDYFQNPVLNYFDIEKLVSLMNLLCPQDRENIMDFICDRYDWTKHYPKISEEIEFLKVLKRIAEKERNQRKKDKKLSWLFWDRDVRTIEKGINYIEKYKEETEI